MVTHVPVFHAKAYCYGNVSRYEENQEMHKDTDQDTAKRVKTYLCILLLLEEIIAFCLVLRRLQYPIHVMI